MDTTVVHLFAEVFDLHSEAGDPTKQTNVAKNVRAHASAPDRGSRDRGNRHPLASIDRGRIA